MTDIAELRAAIEAHRPPGGYLNENPHVITEEDLELHHRENAWAITLGFLGAEEYHEATNEAFAESVRDDWNGE